MRFTDDEAIMRRALELAVQGFGRVEPNPQVGAVIVTPQRQLIAEGWHEQFGGPHAEIRAIEAAGGRTQGADIFITLEPCSHHGKTPPCVDAVLRAGFRRVVVGCEDPAPHAAGRGLQLLREAGVPVESGVCKSAAEDLIAPFARQMLRRLPWVHAKWAMSLDGRISADSGHSKWISSEESRQLVHDLRGRMDAILTGAGTVRADDPLLTARPPGPRRALRVVFDATGQTLSPKSQLVRSTAAGPVLVCVTDICSSQQQLWLQSIGLDVFCSGSGERVDAAEVLAELGRRGLTHTLIEAGPGILGTFFNEQLVDEIHVFVSPKIIGGQRRGSAVAGRESLKVPSLDQLRNVQVRHIGGDVLIEGRMKWASAISR